MHLFSSRLARWRSFNVSSAQTNPHPTSPPSGSAATAKAQPTFSPKKRLYFIRRRGSDNTCARIPVLAMMHLGLKILSVNQRKETSPSHVVFFFFSWRYEGIYKVSRAPFKHLHRTMPMERKDTRTFTHWSKSKNNTVINKDRFCRDNRGTEGRQAGTMLKGVCSWAHKRTHSTDVFWDNTGFNIEHLKQLNKKKIKEITVQAEVVVSPPPQEVFQLAYVISLNPKPRGGVLWASNCRVISHVSSLKTCLWKPAQKNKETK